MLSIWIANGLDLILGDPYWMPHPVRLMGVYIQYFEKSFIKRKVSHKLLGILLTVTTVFLSYGLTLLLLKLLFYFSLYLFYGANIFLLYSCIAGRCLHKEAFKIMDNLKAGDLNTAKKQLSYIVGRDTDKMKDSGVVKAVVETVSENTSDGIIAPLFYMFLGGAPLAMAYKAVNTLDSMVGYKNERYLDFGWASARLDDMVNCIPGRLTALFIILSAFLSKQDYKSSFKTMKRDSKKHLSPNSGYPESAAAGAIGISLGGTAYYLGKAVEKPEIGDKLKEPDNEDIKKVVVLMYGSWIISLILFTIIKHYIISY